MPGKVAIVTGSSRGIGRGIVLTLAARGWDVVINYHANIKAAEATQKEVEKLGSTALLVQADVAQLSDLDRLVEATLKHFGVINMLVNNAGIGPRVRLDMLEVSQESYDEVMGVNLKGPFFLTQRVANEMIRLIEAEALSNPKIVNIGSISSYTSRSTASASQG